MSNEVEKYKKIYRKTSEKIKQLKNYIHKYLVELMTHDNNANKTIAEVIYLTKRIETETEKLPSNTSACYVAYYIDYAMRDIVHMLTCMVIGNKDEATEHLKGALHHLDIGKKTFESDLCRDLNKMEVSGNDKNNS